MEHKSCWKCGKIKPLAEFYNNSAKKDGKATECKLCSKAHDAIRNKRPKRAARAKVTAETRRAISRGVLTRPAVCSKCGKTGNIHAHHDDYNRTLDVKWFCPKCHARYHNSKGRAIHASNQTLLFRTS